MAKKDVAIQPVDYIRGCEWFSEEAVEAYRFLLEADPNAPDYAEQRAAHTEGFHNLWIYMKWCEAVQESIKAAMKQGMSVDPAHLPRGISWAAETKQQAFRDGTAVALALSREFSIPLECFAANISPAQAMKIAHIDKETLVGIVGDNLVETPKERKLMMK